ncbi:Ger(X)C family germination protein [Paenisporosarcina sp. HGH0030]|uniref:Ger(x)C family spore germination protein n=1 Tax=Paenisporosarcina sp. HGH0030 TaxID=1078085 RepID=UPI00034E2AA0|nr:Ger(x)C family spore germination protein [Paenisporosarcina sp. HGH0030]EPD50587.1 Ger(X)C family germination protein [Paenisporosarcina sp. HGH0030]
MKKIKLGFIFVVLFVSLVGCAEQKLLEQIGLTTLLGYDLREDDKLSVTAVVRQVNPEFQSNVEVISAENETIRGARTVINRKTSKKNVTGQMRVVLFGEEISKDGIAHYIDTLSKNSETSGGLYVAVVEGETKSLLEYQYQEIEDIGIHIFKLLEQNIKSEQMISSTIHEVAHDYYSLGRDVALPIIKRKDEIVEISGVALFNKDKMVGKLSAENSFYLKLARDFHKAAMFETKIPKESLPASQTQESQEDITVVIDTISTKKKLKLINPDTPEFDMQFTVRGRLLEIEANMDMDNPKNVQKLEEEIEKSMSKNLAKILVYCQEVDSDVFGLGEFYRSSVRESDLTYEKWHEMYKDAKVNFKIDFTVLRSGIFE